MALTGTISEKLKAEPDLIFDGDAMPNSGNTSSDAFRLGGDQGAREIVFELDTAFTMTTATYLQVDIMECATEAGVYSVLNRAYYTLASGATVITTATALELFRYVIPTDALEWGKVKVTTTDNMAAETAFCWLTPVSR